MTVSEEQTEPPIKPTQGDWPKEALIAALDGVGTGVMLVNAQNRVVLMNHKARSLLSLDTQAVEGMDLKAVLSRSALLEPQTIQAIIGHCQVRDIASHDVLTFALGTQQTSLRVHGQIGRHRALFMAPVQLPSHTIIDPLTGLLDRRGFIDGLQERAHQDQGQGHFAVLALDLGRFKSVNETLGHGLGDALLCAVAERLRGALRRGDLVARLGNDEFAVLVDADGLQDNLELVAHRLVDLLGRRYVLDGHLVRVDVRAGVALSNIQATDAQTCAALLLRQAHLALLEAKREVAGVRVFEDRMQHQADARRDLEMDLRKALRLKQFELHYQPLVNATSGRLVGFEALIRWRHPERGLLQPNDFIPLVEELGLISEIGEWVVREACREAACWPAGLSVSVNASGAQFEDDHLVNVVATALQQTGLPGCRLEVEVTETLLLRRAEATLSALRDLRAMGVRIAMDDFGTGHSSLMQLQSFPFDKLKIDRSFVARLGETDGSTAIVRAIARMGASLGLRTVAEGVETVEQYDRLKAEGCDEMQGYLLSRPVQTSEIHDLFHRFGVREDEDGTAQACSLD